MLIPIKLALRYSPDKLFQGSWSDGFIPSYPYPVSTLNIYRPLSWWEEEFNHLRAKKFTSVTCSCLELSPHNAGIAYCLVAVAAQEVTQHVETINKARWWARWNEVCSIITKCKGLWCVHSEELFHWSVQQVSRNLARSELFGGDP